PRCRGRVAPWKGSHESVGRLCLETRHVASAPSTASRSPETSTRAAGGASASLPVVDVTVVTSRDDFLLELGQALGGQAGVRPVESPDEALQSMAGSKRAQMLVIDARAVADVPLTIGAFRPWGAASTDDEEGAQKPRLVLIGAAVAATALVGGAFWYFMPGSGFSTRGAAPAAATHAAPPAAAAAAAAAATESPGGVSAAASEALLVQGKVDDLLEKARLAMHERRYTEPAGDNALLYYRSAIAQDPHNGEALDGLSRVAGVLAGRVEDAISSGHLDEAALTLASFKSAAPNDLRSGPLEQRLSSAQ